MNELIKIQSQEINNELVNSVNSRDLYKALELGAGQYSRWIKTNLLENEFFVENRDYIGVQQEIEGNQVITYIVTLDTAKHLSMISKSKKAHEIREYFIQCEKKINELQFIDKINEIINIPNIDEFQKEGFVYLIKCDDSYKIGVSKKPHNRLNTLQTGTAKKLELIYYKKFDDCYKVEKYLHKTFNDKRISGEWFNLEIRDIDKFYSICENSETYNL